MDRSILHLMATGKLRLTLDQLTIRRSVAIQSDGKIIAVGFTTSDFAIARYNADGTLDMSFDGDGKVTTDFGGTTDQAFSVALQPDGRIIVAGLRITNGPADDFVVARYNVDGSLDATFDGDGKVATDIGNNFNWAFSVAVQPDGKLVAAGFSTSTSRDFALVRYNSDGSLDTSFDADGKVTTDIGATRTKHGQSRYKLMERLWPRGTTRMGRIVNSPSFGTTLTAPSILHFMAMVN